MNRVIFRKEVKEIYLVPFFASKRGRTALASDNGLRFKYVFRDDFSPRYANGVFGGATPKGEINMNFFLERFPVPKSVYHEIDTDTGRLGKEMSREPEQKMIIRDIVAGVVLNYDEAKAIHNWLGDRLAEIESRKALAQHRDEEVQ
ncbi:hypothetical protein [Desulfohalovibrio reitneri]|uniref:hypothetical protein n=1 Tax=Desulfohalovibrio reitneri TaxID=1307759 RepID=UPI0019298F44|nr:hypothetical protein [Desulfohalovibrio reitneri]